MSMLPVDLYWFPEGLFVIRGLGEYERLIGSKVTRIGGRRPEDLLRALEPYVSRDNAMAFKTFGPVYLTFPLFLDALGLPLPGGRVELTLSDSTGRERSVLITPGPNRRFPRKLGPPIGASTPPPMYLESIQTPYWIRRLPEHQTVYLQFNQVVNAEGEPLARFARRLADTRRASRVRRRAQHVESRLYRGG